MVTNLIEKPLDNQTLTIENIIQRVAIAFVVVSMAILAVMWGVGQAQTADPYIKAVMAQPGDADRGYAIFQMNCASCHGVTADGRVGPSLHHISERKSNVGLIHQVTSGETPPMPQFQPSPEDMADLLRYLETL